MIGLLTSPAVAPATAHSPRPYLSLSCAGLGSGGEGPTSFSGLAAVTPLESIEIELPLAEVFYRVDFDEAGALG